MLLKPGISATNMFSSLLLVQAHRTYLYTSTLQILQSITDRLDTLETKRQIKQNLKVMKGLTSCPTC